MPEHFLRRQFGGKSPDEVFARVGFSGDHSRTIQLVQSGAYEIGALDHTVWEFEKKAGKIDEAQVQVIWETPPYPDYNWTVRGDVDATYGAGFKDKVKAALLAIDDPAILNQFARSKFIPAKNSDYTPIEEVGKATNLLN
jgi:phosphonate transport system substrate-binding protein